MDLDNIQVIEQNEQISSDIQYKEKPFFQEWVEFMMSGRLRAIVLGGDDAIDKASTIKKQVRSEYAPNEKGFNIVVYDPKLDMILSANSFEITE